jgi:hypothetical protein
MQSRATTALEQLQTSNSDWILLRNAILFSSFWGSIVTDTNHAQTLIEDYGLSFAQHLVDMAPGLK